MVIDKSKFIKKNANENKFHFLKFLKKYDSYKKITQSVFFYFHVSRLFFVKWNRQQIES